MKTKDQENTPETTSKLVFPLDVGIKSVTLIVLIRHHQTFNTHGISGNARVVNIGGDNITHINDGLGADMYDVLESINDRLEVVQDKELSTLAFEFSMFL